MPSRTTISSRTGGGAVAVSAGRPPRIPDAPMNEPVTFASAFVAGDRGASEWTFVSGGVSVRGCDLFEFEGEKIRVKNAFRKSRP